MKKGKGKTHLPETQKKKKILPKGTNNHGLLRNPILHHGLDRLRRPWLVPVKTRVGKTLFRHDMELATTEEDTVETVPGVKPTREVENSFNEQELTLVCHEFLGCELTLDLEMEDLGLRVERRKREVWVPKIT